MLELNKNYVFDENQNAIAVQIPITEFEKVEEIIEDYGLAQLIEEALDNEEDTEIVSRDTIFKKLSYSLSPQSLGERGLKEYGAWH